MVPMKKKFVMQDAAITLLLTMERGIIAVAPLLDSHVTNKAQVTADPHNSPIILALRQG